MTRTERTYYVVLGGYTVAQWFVAPVYPLFLLSRGLDLFQINAVLATYLLTVFVFDVPTGALADRVGRKASFLLACLVRMAAYFLYAFAGTFADCLKAEFIDAIGTTLASGALDAWAVDGVRADGDARPPARLFARGQVVMHVVMIGAGVASGYVAETGWSVPWFVSAGLFAVTAVLGATLMHEAPRARPAGPPASLGRTALAGLRTVRDAPVLLLVCLLTLAAAFAGFPLHMTWQARVQAMAGNGLWRIGWILALLNAAALVGSALVPRLLPRFERETVLSVAAAWRAGMLTLAAGATTLSPVLAGLLLQEVTSGLTEPLLAAWMNEHVAPAYRATVLSVRSTFFTLGGAMGLVSLGLLARTAGIPAAWTVSAAVFAVMAPGYLFLGRTARRVAVGEAPVELVAVPSGKIVPPAPG